MTLTDFLIAVLLALYLFVVSTPHSYGQELSARQLHDISHASVGAAAGFVSYGVWKAVLGPEQKPLATLLGLASVVAAAAVWEAHPKGSMRDFTMGTLGAGGATMTIMAFDF